MQEELPTISDKEIRRAKGLATVEEAIDEFRNGRFVIIIDDEDRENEGDLTIAAQFATPEAINFMARYGRGLICVPMTHERLERCVVSEETESLAEVSPSLIMRARTSPMPSIKAK